MTRKLKCLKCKKVIKEDEKAFRCADCETYPFHEDCLDDEGNCDECAETQEEEGEDEEVEIEISTNGDTWILDCDYTRKEAEALIADVSKAIATGKPVMKELAEEGHYFVLRNISELKIKEC